MMWSRRYLDFEAKYRAARRWHFWFAKYPVRLGPYGNPGSVKVWLQTVERRTSRGSADRTCYDDGYGLPIWNWEYRLPEHKWPYSEDEVCL